MKKTTLVIMAAGIGSRFGQGIKQLEPIGPNGETIMDYSVHDALSAGFDKIIFIIRRELEGKFRESIGKRIEGIIDVDYVFQENDNIPEIYRNKWERRKPWGTGQAIMSLRGTIKTSFAVINADDYYGKEAFVRIHEYMVNKMDTECTIYDICMVSFILANTLSENGGVTRGICITNDMGKLKKIKETYEIKKCGSEVYGIDDCRNKVHLNSESIVSMNMWGCPLGFLDLLESNFVDFLKNLKNDDVESEYLLPEIIDCLLKRDSVTVEVLKTKERWYGLTYQEDIMAVKKAIKILHM